MNILKPAGSPESILQTKPGLNILFAIDVLHRLPPTFGPRSETLLTKPQFRWVEATTNGVGDGCNNTPMDFARGLIKTFCRRLLQNNQTFCNHVW